MPRPQRRRDDRPRFEGGAQYIDEEAGDRSGKGRGPGLALVTILAVLVLLMPVLWSIGMLDAYTQRLGTAVLAGLWIVWGIVLVLFGWSLWSLWRRAA